MEKNEPKIIDVQSIAKKILSNRKAYIKPLLIVFVQSCIYIFSLPRYYSSDAKLAPEMGGDMGGGTLSSIAASFGFNMGDMQTSDAITPLLYPVLMDDNGFVAKLFPIKVTTSEGNSYTYFDYLKKHQKKTWWSGFFNSVKKLFKKKPKGKVGNSPEFDPYNLSMEDDGVLKHIQDNIKMTADKKTGIISISVEDQDPLICRSMADSLLLLLQEFITEYRTNKARIDADYYTVLADSAKAEYEKASALYARYADTNLNTVFESYRTKLSSLENDMSLKYNTYSAINTQLQAARSKVQERTPAFTVIQGAAIPVKPAGPKRMIFVFAMMLLTFIGTTFYVYLRKEPTEKSK